MEGKFAFGLLVIIAVVITGILFVLSPSSGLSPEKYCGVDSDCLPNACCHANGTVNKNYFPDCAGMVCTAECVPATLDCAQGEIKCIRHECTIVWNK